MRRYALTRVLLLLPTLFGVTLVVFISVRLLPGDVVDQILAETGSTDPELAERLREQYRLNDNIATQYVAWLGDIVQMNFGTSITSGRPVLSDLADRVPVTMQLGTMALLVSLVVALPVGIVSAVYQDRWIDYVARSGGILLIAVPSFWMALLVITYGFQWFGWTPPLRYHRPLDAPLANMQTMIVPATILGASLAGIVIRMTRSMMLEVLRQDYIRTARAKGLNTRTVITRHAMRNALIPIVTIVGLQVGVVVGGTVILERIFSIPGMGSYLLDAVSHRDYPVIQAIVLINAFVVLTSNLIVDLVYVTIDPRVRL